MCRSNNLTRKGFDMFARDFGCRATDGNGGNYIADMAKNWGGQSSDTKNVFLII
jgi:hypothetical protein